MKVEIREEKNVKIVKLTGQIRISTQNDFKDLLDDISAKDSNRTLILNLDGVIYMNSAGLGIIIDAYKKFKENKGRMILCNLMPDISKLFEVTRINRFLEIHATEQDALDAV